MNNYSQLLRISWQVIVGGCLSSAILGCVQSDSEGKRIAGIDGSGKDPVIDQDLGISEGDRYPLVAQGSINGFGSVIVHGEHYDTSEAEFYRHDKRVTEADFDVGDMIAVSGYKDENGELFAERVYFEPSVTGRVEAYDDIAGVATVLGQRVRIDAETVIGASLSDRLLFDQEITVSGWLQDNEVLATRVTLGETPEINQVRGHIRNIDPVHMCAQIGLLSIDYSSLSEPLVASEGDIVLFEGVLSNEGGEPRKLVASKAINFATRLAQSEVVVESAVVAGTVRNIESTRFWINGVEISRNADTVIEYNGTDGINSGSRLVVKGVPTSATELLAEHITVKSNILKQTVAGAITALQSDSSAPLVVEVDGREVVAKAETAIVDLLQDHSRLTLETLNIGDYVVVTASSSENQLVASSIKRTQQGVNDRKFDGTDELPYDWGFEFGKRSETDDSENLLFSGKLLSVQTGLNRLVLSNGLVQIKFGPANSTWLLVDSEGNEIPQDSAAAVIGELLNEQSNRTIWVNLQGDRRDDLIYADRMVIKLDWYGREITGELIPE